GSTGAEKERDQVRSKWRHHVEKCETRSSHRRRLHFHWRANERRARDRYRAGNDACSRLRCWIGCTLINCKLTCHLQQSDGRSLCSTKRARQTTRFWSSLTKERRSP